MFIRAKKSIYWLIDDGGQKMLIMIKLFEFAVTGELVALKKVRLDN